MSTLQTITPAHRWLIRSQYCAILTWVAYLQRWGESELCFLFATYFKRIPWCLLFVNCFFILLCIFLSMIFSSFGHTMQHRNLSGFIAVLTIRQGAHSGRLTVSGKIIIIRRTLLWQILNVPHTTATITKILSVPGEPSMLKEQMHVMQMIPPVKASVLRKKVL